MNYINQNKRFQIEDTASTIVVYIDFEKSTLSDGTTTKRIIATRMRIIDRLIASYFESPEDSQLGFLSYEEIYAAAHPEDADGNRFKKEKII